MWASGRSLPPEKRLQFTWEWGGATKLPSEHKMKEPETTRVGGIARHSRHIIPKQGFRDGAPWIIFLKALGTQVTRDS